MSPYPKSTVGPDGILIVSVDVRIRSNRFDVTLPARLYHNYQRERSTWAEVSPDRLLIGTSEVEVSSAFLESFPAVLEGGRGTQSDGRFVISRDLVPLREPIESTAATNLSKIRFALLDSPTSADAVPEQQTQVIAFPCGQFGVTINDVADDHREIRSSLGLTPHRLTNSGTLAPRDGIPFSSKAGGLALDTLNDALSLAAGRWVGITLVEGVDADGGPVWFRWGLTRMSTAPHRHAWYDPQHPQWLNSLCDGLLRAKSEEATSEALRSALYWYIRSNGNTAGVDSSLILSQCALELLSWLVIVKKTVALSESGYGQLGDAAEKLRLALTLLGIPRAIPPGLKHIHGFRKEWKDIADTIVQTRNYLVHPTQSRSGKRRAKEEYPFFEVWVAAQWLLELMILRLIGYRGSYRNRTRLRDFDQIERVPWS